MSDELKAAANRLIGVGIPGLYLPQDGARDAETVARAYLADLAAREAEEGSRAVRIDEAWLQSIGFTQSVGELVIESVWHLITVGTGKVKLFNKQTIQSVTIGWSVSTTRGQILDLMAGLKIPMKGGAA